MKDAQGNSGACHVILSREKTHGSDSGLCGNYHLERNMLKVEAQVGQQQKRKLNQMTLFSLKCRIDNSTLQKNWEFGMSA